MNNTTNKIRETYEAYHEYYNTGGFGNWEIYNDSYKCGNCGHGVTDYCNYCEMCGFKFINIKDVNIGRIKATRYYNGRKPWLEEQTQKSEE